jgi:hypothetical protein
MSRRSVYLQRERKKTRHAAGHPTGTVRGETLLCHSCLPSQLTRAGQLLWPRQCADSHQRLAGARQAAHRQPNACSRHLPASTFGSHRSSSDVDIRTAPAVGGCLGVMSAQTVTVQSAQTQGAAATPRENSTLLPCSQPTPTCIAEPDHSSVPCCPLVLVSLPLCWIVILILIC